MAALYEVMRATATTRAFLPDPVPDEVLYRVLDNARFAPNGSNHQGWRVVVVKDHAKRHVLQELNRRPMLEYKAEVDSGQRVLTPAEARRMLQGLALADVFDQVPVHLAVFVDLGALSFTDRRLERPSIVGGASIYPFVQNLILGLRAEGLGAALTTLVAGEEPDVKEMLGVPDQYAMAALVIAGWPAAPFATQKRRPVENFATIDAFDGEPFTVARG